MSKRSALASLTIVVAAAAIAGGWLLHRGPESIVAPVIARSTPSRAESPAPLPAPAVVPGRSSVDEPTTNRHGAVGGLIGRRDMEKAPAPKEAKTIAIDGVVIVTDAQGVEHREESGTLRSRLFEPAREGGSGAIVPQSRISSPGDEVGVAAGRFHVEVPPDRSLGVGTLVLGGKPAVAEGDPIEVKAGEPVTIRAHWIDSILLHVVDATSHVELDGVTVVRARERYLATHSQPGAYGPEDTVADHAASPVPVAAAVDPFGVRTYDVLFARASGHAWGHVVVDYEESNEKTIALGPAATLIVEVRGELPHRAARPPSLREVAGRLFGGGPKPATADPDGPPSLCLRAPSDAPEFDAAAKEALDHFDEAKAEDFPGGRKPKLEEYKRSIEEMRGQYEATRNVGELELSLPAVLGETRLDSLQPGEFLVSVEFGEHMATPLVAGRAPVKLVAGETTRATLVLASIAAAEPVPLAGTLFVPAGWYTNSLALTISPLDLAGPSDSDQRQLQVASMVALPGRPGWFHWSAGVVLPATYEFTIDDAVYAHVEKIGPSGNDHLELKLGEPALLIVHVVDEASGAPVPLELLRYTAAFLDGWTGTLPSTDLTRDAGHDRYTGRVPVGAGRIESFGDWDWTLDRSEAPLEVHSGEQEVTLRVHRTCGVRIALACGIAKVEWPEDLAFECRIEPVGVVGRWLWTNEEEGLPRFAVAHAGRYRVTLPPIPGYEQVEPFEVDVPAGEFVTKSVELTRK